MVSGRWIVGERTGLSIPADPASLRDGGVALLTKAFQTPVKEITRCEEVSGGSTGRKLLLDVTYLTPQPDCHTELFVKFSRDFDDPVRDHGRTQMESEVRFASLSSTPDFPIVVADVGPVVGAFDEEVPCLEPRRVIHRHERRLVAMRVPRTQFGDYHRGSGTGILISERIRFGTNGIEVQHHKCVDYEMCRQADHYRALLTAIARLAGTHRSGRLPARLTDQFPVDLRAAAVGEPPPLSPEKLQRRLLRLAEFTRSHPGLLPDTVRSPEFLARLAAEAPRVLQREPAIWRYLTDAKDYIALSHWNANVDNAWFWNGSDGTLQCGLMDWGCVSQLNLAMAIWGAMSGAENQLWDRHFDEFAQLVCDEVHASGGPRLEPAELQRQVLLYAVLMGIRWLLDVPALIRAKAPDATRRTDPPIRDDEGVRAPLQMLTNVLNLWSSTDLSGALAQL